MAVALLAYDWSQEGIQSLRLRSQGQGLFPEEQGSGEASLECLDQRIQSNKGHEER